MMQLRITARSREQAKAEYTDLETHTLEASIQHGGGSGLPEDPYQVRVVLTNRSTLAWTGVIHIELPFPKSEPRFFLPGFMYGRNRGESPQNVLNEFPRLREGHPSRPSSPWWMTRSDRLSHPAALVYESGKVYGLSAAPYVVRDRAGQKRQWRPGVDGEFYQYTGYTCSIGAGAIGYTLGYENAPLLFIKSKLVKERSPLGDNVFELAAGETFEAALNLYCYDAASELGIQQALEQIYEDYHESPRTGSDVPTAVADLAGAIQRDAWLPEDRAYSGFVFEDEDAAGGYRYNKLPSITWTNGLSVATPMLLAALRLQDEAMREAAIACVEHIVAHSLNPASGLPYETCNDGKWSIRGWWFDGMHTAGHSSYLAGQSMYYILKAYEYEYRLGGCKHSDWLPFVKGVLQQLERTKNTDGEYPYILSEKTGAGLEYDSFSGTWCLAALAYYSWLTGDHTRLSSLRDSEIHYYETYVRRMECYGAPLDTDKAIDSEGILAYIKALRYLHALTGEEVYLDHMRDALGYEFSFKFAYNSPVQVPPLSTLGWSSAGGSITSVANPHIHPMSNNIVDEILYYLQKREDDHVHSRMNDTVGWGCQTYNRYDREFDHGKRGWMSERFCHSEGLLTQTYADGSPASTWFALMPWAGSSIIEGMVGDYWDYDHARQAAAAASR